jgi:hypothetical protein
MPELTRRRSTDARAVLKAAPVLAGAVMSGAKSLDVAYERAHAQGMTT